MNIVKYSELVHMAETPYELVTNISRFFFFFFFLNSVLRPFQDYFSSYETGQSLGGRKREDPEKNHLAHPQSECGQSEARTHTRHSGEMIE